MEIYIGKISSNVKSCLMYSMVRFNEIGTYVLVHKEQLTHVMLVTDYKRERKHNVY